MSTGNFQLADYDERDRAARDWGGTYLVEAAAGTGKTTLLISRILTIVTETLTPLSRVAAITFTEKAAGELKARLRKTLEENAQKTDESGERCRKALRDLDVMPVSTIHAFCRELLQQRPVEAGVDPGFTVLDESSAGMLREEVWQTWIAAEFAHDAPARALLERGFSLESMGRASSLHALFDMLLSAREDLDALHVPARTGNDLLFEIAGFRREIADALRLKSGCRDSSDKLLTSIREVERWAATFPSDDMESALAWLSERPKVNGRHTGRKENWDADLHKAARAFFIESFEARAAELACELFSGIAAPALEWLKRGARAYEEAKTARGVLDFHDLLLGARNMLLHHADVREFFKTRYDYLLVDEFQDTDPLQTEIVFFLAERANQSAEQWDTVELEEGKLFLVGDPKQSIYRFRRADLDLYGRVKERIEHGGDCLPIRVNFRSRPELIHEINTLFASWMTGATEERYEPEYVAMEAYRGADASRPGALFLPPPRSFDLAQNSDALAEAEAAAIAEFIGEQTGVFFVPGDNGDLRPLRYGDIGVLYATTTHLLALENALKARDIPFRVAGGRNLPLRSEMIALRAVLNAVDNPYDATSVAGALRSPFFGCSDDELLEHRLNDGRFDYLSEIIPSRRGKNLPFVPPSTGGEADAPAASRLQKSLDVLRALHETRRMCSPSETLAELFSQTAGLQVFALKPQGETRAANLLNVMETARAFERSGSYSFHRLARWLERLEDFRAGEEDYPGDDDDDAVQLLTFHKAKGLEFPAVILYQITNRPERQTASVVHDRARKAIEFKSAAGETVGFSRAKTDELNRQDYESRRLFYVACTRARDLLVIPAYWQSTEKKRESSRFVAMLESRYPVGESNVPRVDGGDFQLHPTEQYNLETEPREGLLLDLSAVSNASAIQQARREHQEWEAARTRAAARLNHAHDFVKPSEHAGFEAAALEKIQKYAPRSAVSFGLFVHRLMQQIELPGGNNLESLANTASLESGLSDSERSEGMELVKRARGSHLFQERIGKAEGIYRELGFTAEIEGKLVEGTVDLLFIKDGQPVIVDFKTDHVSAEQVAERAESYRHQAAAYLRALEAVLKKPVREVVLYFLRPDVAVKFGRDELVMVKL